MNFDWQNPAASWLIKDQMPLLKEVGDADRSAPVMRIDGTCTDFIKLQEFSALEELHIFGLTQKNTKLLAHLKKLKRLAIRGGGVSDLFFLKDLTSLEMLNLWQTSRLKSLSSLEAVQNLKMLVVFEATSRKWTMCLDPISNLQKLEYLELRGPMMLSSLSPVENLFSLKRLLLLCDFEDKSLRALLRLKNLKKLEMWKMDKHFPLEELAIAARIQPELMDLWFNYRANEIWLPCKKCKNSTVVLIGLGTKAFCPKCDPERGEKFRQHFIEMVNEVAI